MPPNQNQEPRINNHGEIPAAPGLESQPVPTVPEPVSSSGVDSAPVTAASQSVQLPQIPNPVSSSNGVIPSAASSSPGNPMVADDVDVIEKEWVDQADKIIEQTKGDPYLEEEAIESLQIDYLKKRYGHNIKKPTNNS